MKWFRGLRAGTRRTAGRCTTRRPRRCWSAADIEEQIKALKLTGDAKQPHRLTHSKPLVERLFDWIDRLHSTKRVAELTLWLWKPLFATNALRSDIHQFPV